MLFAATFAVLVGLLLLGTGISLLVGSQMPVLEENVRSAVWRWGAEFITAILLVIGGFGVLLESTWARPVFAVAIATFLLTVIDTLASCARWRCGRQEWRRASSGTLSALLMPFLTSSL
jgi:hypothetical protein